MQQPTQEEIAAVAVMTAKNFVKHNPGMRKFFDDVLGDAMLGATQAAKSFDPSRSVKFSTWGYFRALGAIKDGLREWSIIPRAEWAKGVRHGDPQVPHFVPLEFIGGRHHDQIFERQIEDPWATADMELVDVELTVRALLGHVEGRQREVLERVYWGHECLWQIAEDWGVTESRVCQVHRQALSRLRDVAEAA